MADTTAVEWLLAADEPAIRYRARTWLVLTLHALRILRSARSG